MELQELKKEFGDFPVGVKTDEVSDSEQDFSLDAVDSELGATKVPYLPPPTFCSGLSEEPLSLIRATNKNTKIILAISLTSIICCVAFGYLTLFIFFGKQADNSSNSDSQYCETCVSRLDLNLQVLTDLGEILANLTRVLE